MERNATALTSEQLEILQPVVLELEELFFDMAGRLDEKDYFGEFKVEAYKTSLFLNRDFKLPQYLSYKYIRQHSLTVSDMDVEEEYNMMNHAVRLGIEIVRETFNQK